MLNLDEAQLPKYEIQLNGEIHEYDPLDLAIVGETLAGKRDPKLAREAVAKVLGFEVTSFQAIQILEDVTHFVEEYVAPKLKNLSSPSSSSTITTDSLPESAAN